MTFHEVIELFNSKKPQVDSTTNSKHTRVEKVDLEEDAMELLYFSTASQCRYVQKLDPRLLIIYFSQSRHMMQGFLYPFAFLIASLAIIHLKLFIRFL